MIYARIDNGVVAELFTTQDGFSIENSVHADLVAHYVPVPADVSPEQGWTYDGSTFTPPAAPPPPSLAEQAAAALLQPVEIACTSIPDLGGTYPIDLATRANITAVAAAINAGLGLPSGGDTFDWRDAAGTAHAWPAAQFTAFAQAVMRHVYTLTQIAAGGSGPLPASPITIA